MSHGSKLAITVV